MSAEIDRKRDAIVIAWCQMGMITIEDCRALLSRPPWWRRVLAWLRRLW